MKPIILVGNVFECPECEYRMIAQSGEIECPGCSKKYREVIAS